MGPFIVLNDIIKPENKVIDIKRTDVSMTKNSQLSFR